MKNKKSENKNEYIGGWKKIAQAFVGDILARASENVADRINVGIKKLKRRTAGAALMILGITFLLTGVAVYANTVLEKVTPGIGYGIVGLVILLAGYIISRD